MAETNIEKEFLKHHKSDHVQFSLKTLPVHSSATQKEQSEPIKAIYINDPQSHMQPGAHL